VKAVGGKSVEIETAGATVADVIRSMTDRFGEPLARYLLDASGQLDQSFRVVLESGEWLTRDKLDRPVKDGSKITVAMLVGGG